MTAKRNRLCVLYQWCGKWFIELNLFRKQRIFSYPLGSLDSQMFYYCLTLYYEKIPGIGDVWDT